MSWQTNDSHVITKGPCTANGCRSSDAKHHYSDGHAYCFSCSTYFPAEHRRTMAPPYDVPKPKSDVYPNRLPVTQHHCGRNYTFLKQYGLTDDEIDEHYFYAPLTDRHIFSVRDPDTNEEFYEARTHSRNIVPKSLQYGTKPIAFMGDCQSSVLVIVEDAVSAIKVGRQATTMPLFGSFLSPIAMAKIGRLERINQCVIWLDCDKYDKGMEYAKALGMFRPCVAIQTLADPKDLDDSTITVALEAALDALEAV